MKRPMFSGGGGGVGGGESDTIRVIIAVMAPAEVPTAIMILLTVPRPAMVLVTRFHHRGRGGLTGWV
jgi:hypothetical protein